MENKSKYLAILMNENPRSCLRWEKSCQNINIQYDIIDLTASDWFERISNKDYAGFLVQPPGELARFKELFNERLYVIAKVLNKLVYPSYDEVALHENKRYLSFFLRASQIPHPQTWVFYKKDEALKFALNAELPVVAKTMIGASGTGVEIIKTKTNLDNYINRAFGKGIKRRLGPNRQTGNIKTWCSKAFGDPGFAIKKIKKYFEIYKDTQNGFAIFQEYIPHDFEWRAVKIGESYFAHKKIKYKDMASGSKGIDYVNPPLGLLHFVRDLCETNGFSCMAVDLFEDGKGGFLVNELQTIFGHVQDHIMEVDGKPGRYRFQNQRWVFEEGDFNTNESYDLRLQTAIELYKDGKL